MPRSIEDDRPVMKELGVAQLDRISGGTATPAQPADKGGRQPMHNTVDRMMAEGPNERLPPNL